MNPNIKNYILSGTTMIKNLKQYFILQFGPFLLLPFNLMIGFVLGGWYTVFSVGMMGLALILCLFGLFLYRKKTVVAKLWCQAFIYLHFILQFLTIQILCFSMTYGSSFALIFLIIPLFLIPVITIYFHHRKIKKSSFQFEIKPATGKIALIGGSLGLSIYLFAKQAIASADFSQNKAILFVVLIILLINSLFSIGFLNFHKIYLCKKFDLKE